MSKLWAQRRWNVWTQVCFVSGKALHISKVNLKFPQSYCRQFTVTYHCLSCTPLHLFHLSTPKQSATLASKLSSMIFLHNNTLPPPSSHTPNCRSVAFCSADLYLSIMSRGLVNMWVGVQNVWWHMTRVWQSSCLSLVVGPWCLEQEAGGTDVFVGCGQNDMSPKCHLTAPPDGLAR